MPDSADRFLGRELGEALRQRRRATAAAETKSTVPAMRVLRPSVGKRVMARMPDSPAVSLAQLSALPAPSEVTTPMPVTTTTGRPALSLVDDMARSPSADPLRPARGLRRANARRRSPAPGSTARSSAAPVRSSRRAETDYHGRARPRPARYSWGIAAPAHARDRCRWRARQGRHAPPGRRAPRRSRARRRWRRRAPRRGRP